MRPLDTNIYCMILRDPQAITFGSIGDNEFCFINENTQQKQSAR